MNIQSRLRKIEANSINSDCFCNKTFVDLVHGGASPNTYCPKCKDKYDFWANLAADARNDEPRCRNCGAFFKNLNGCRMGLTLPECCDFLNSKEEIQ